MTTKRQLWYSLALLLVLLAAVAVWMTYRSPQRGKAPNSTVEDRATAGSRVTSPAGDAGAPRNPPRSVDQAEEIDESSNAPVSDAGGVDVQRDQRCELVLRIVDGKGTPLPMSDFKYCILKPGEHMRPERGQYVIDPPLEAAQTDVNGEWKAAARFGGTLFIRLVDPNWICVTERRSHQFRFLPDGPDVAVFRIRKESHQTFTLTLDKPASCVLDIRYADGEPYAGEVRILEFTDQARKQRAHNSDKTLTYQPGMVIPVTPSNWLRVGVRCPRGGFKEHVGANPTQEDVADGVLTIIIPADPARREPSGFILDHTGFAPGQVMLAVLMPKGTGFTGFTMTLSGPGETRTDYFGYRQMRCVAAGDGVIWSSGLITFEPGEWKRVLVDPTPPARLSLVVQDENGQPLPNAVMSCEETGYFDYAWPEVPKHGDSEIKAPNQRSDLLSLTNRLGRAGADADGRVEFSSAWPGKRRYIVQDLGYESRLIEADAAPGRLTDLGTIQLVRATAKVTVHIKVAEGAAAGDFAVSMFQWGARMHRERVPFNDDGMAAVENLPAGRCQVFVSPRKGGGAGHFKILELVSGDSQEVTIDLTKPPGLQED